MSKPTLLFLLALVLTAGGAFYLGKRSAGPTVLESTSAPEGDIPVVFRTKGGMIEVAKMVYKQRFEAKEKGRLMGIDLSFCPTAAAVTVRAHFTYRVRLAKEWKVRITQDKRVVTVVPALEPALPVAFDSTTLSESLQGCPVIKDGTLAERLRKQISPKLAVKANLPEYKRQVRDHAALTVAEFLRKWYLQNGEYSYAKNYPIEVHFKGEPIESLM